MQDPAVFDELDLRIVSALQLNPRAPWSLVGDALGIDPVTARRRWQRLEEAGAAWITVYPPVEPTTVFALVEIECAPDRVIDVAETLSARPEVYSVEVQAGSRDVFVEVVAPDSATLSQQVLDDVSTTPGVRDVRTRPVITVYSDIIHWPIGALAANESKRMREGLVLPSAPPRRYEPHELEVLGVLSVEPRIPVSELAARLGVSPTTARRRLDAVLAHQTVLRCDIAQHLSPWPVRALFTADVPAADVDRIGRALAALPEVRAAVIVAGPHNLMFSTMLRRLDQVHALEVALAEQLPELAVVDRGVQLRPVKETGHLLDASGRSTGVVPIGIAGGRTTRAKRDAAPRAPRA